MRVLPLLLLAGCWRNMPAAPIAPIANPDSEIVTRTAPLHISAPRCRVTVDHMIDVARVELARNDNLKDHIPDFRRAAIASCKATVWTDDAHSCFSVTADFQDIQHCYERLSADQRRDLTQRINNLAHDP